MRVTAPRWVLARTWGAERTDLRVESRMPTGVVEALRAEGLEFWGSPQDWPDTWSRVLYAKDPEGNVIEFNELPDGGDRPMDAQGERA